MELHKTVKGLKLGKFVSLEALKILLSTVRVYYEGCGQVNDNARGIAECVRLLSTQRTPRLIMPVAYKRERCFNWLVARVYGEVKLVC